MLWNEASALVCLPQSMFEIMFEQSWGKNYNVRPRQILSCPAQLFSQLTIELVKRNFMSGYAKNSLQLSKILRRLIFYVQWSRLQSDSFSSWHQKSCFMCVLTPLEWLIIWFGIWFKPTFLYDCLYQIKKGLYKTM